MWPSFDQRRLIGQSQRTLPAASNPSLEPLHLLLSPEYSPLSIIACYTISQTSNHQRTLLSCYPINLVEKHATAVQRVISHHATMSSRNRQPRASLNQDADEERRLWSMIREGAKKIDSMVVCCRSLFVFFSMLYTFLFSLYLFAAFYAFWIMLKKKRRRLFGRITWLLEFMTVYWKTNTDGSVWE